MTPDSVTDNYCAIKSEGRLHINKGDGRLRDNLWEPLILRQNTDNTTVSLIFWFPTPYMSNRQPKIMVVLSLVKITIFRCTCAKMAKPANERKLISTLKPHSEHFHCRIPNSTTSILTLLVLSYLLTCVDRFSRWQDAFPMRDLAAETVARIFTERWIATFSVPSTITTDRGT
ncbi:unnamed protein product [Hymenolepis diminuta]|uniref:Integrase catalytic domain-containing protein n=1 Tax=Hymenolepis diminuta TaxID=6216 RepID=A0A564YTM7_HYMDI|nr:unnamed protein product [Hymenolepis diminuta]